METTKHKVKVMTTQTTGSGGNIPWIDIALILTILALSMTMHSCRSHSHLTTERRDSVRVETVTRTEYVTDTVTVEIPVERLMRIEEDSSHLETEYAVSDAFIRADGMLYHTLENKGGKRPFEVKKEVVYRDSIVYRDRAVTETREVERGLTWWQRVRLKGFWALAVMIGALLCYIRKR